MGSNDITRSLTLRLVLLTTRATNSWGRKPVILIGAIGVSLSMILFGTSKSYARMLVARSLGGLIGGMDTTLRVMASELASRESDSPGGPFSHLLPPDG